VRLDHVVGVAAAAGVAFTVSLFVAQLAFPTDAGLLSEANIGILGSAIIAGPLGFFLLRRATRRDRAFARSDEAA
jgi:NhaA family Na+:H+ antiporter